MQTFVGLTLSRPRADLEAAKRQSVRRIELRGQPCLQWTHQFPRHQTHENLSFQDSVERARTLLQDCYRNAHLFTTKADIAARITKSGDWRVSRSPPSRRSPQVAQHDRPKNYLIPEGTPCPFLEKLGVMTDEGRVRKSRQHKFRQINRYLEFIDDVYEHLPQTGRLEVIDFGCGLSYLTFALHHLLANVRRRDVQIRGIDRNEAVIERCTQTAEDLDARGLDFQCASIGSLTSERPTGPVHLAVSLHACDTATDEALAAAVRLGAHVILAVPCCQHELFTQLDAAPLELITRHGILKERFAALATDALRVAVLEQSGYRTQIIEFIETEHTPKNLLIRAVQREQSTSDRLLPERLAGLKNLLGIERTRLESLLAEDLG